MLLDRVMNNFYQQHSLSLSMPNGWKYKIFSLVLESDTSWSTNFQDVLNSLYVYVFYMLVANPFSGQHLTFKVKT